MLRFKITTDNIAQGEPKSVNNCAAARAIRTAHPESYIAVSPQNVHIDSVNYPTPKELAEFIYRYDKNMTVEPMEFELTPA